MKAELTIHWASEEAENGFEQATLTGELHEIENFCKALDEDMFTWEINLR